MYIPGFSLCHATSSWPGFHTCLLSLSFIDYLRCRNNWRFFKNTVIKQVLCNFTTLHLLQWQWKQSFASLCRKLCRSFIFFSDGRWCGDVVLSCLQVWFPEFHHQLWAWYIDGSDVVYTPARPHHPPHAGERWQCIRGTHIFVGWVVMHRLATFQTIFSGHRRGSIFDFWFWESA